VAKFDEELSKKAGKVTCLEIDRMVRQCYNLIVTIQSEFGKVSDRMDQTDK
jgi:hypothetical protein